jgi:hypothetical protein
MTENLPATNNVTHWQPSAGETISGVIQGSGSFKNALYDEQKTMLLLDDKGSVVSVGLNRYLIHSLKQNNAALGDLVTVTFHGKEQKNNGRSFNRYTLLVEITSFSKLNWIELLEVPISVQPLLDFFMPRKLFAVICACFGK